MNRNIVRIWEAARATSAASGFFDPMLIGSEKFRDGATPANNPIEQLWMEAIDVFGHDAGPEWRLENEISCLLSIGTGSLRLNPFNDNMLEILNTLKQITTDADQAATKFARHHRPLFLSKRAFRFNVSTGLDSVGLEEQQKVAEIQTATRLYVERDEIVIDMAACAKALIGNPCV